MSDINDLKSRLKLRTDGDDDCMRVPEGVGTVLVGSGVRQVLVPDGVEVIRVRVPGRQSSALLTNGDRVDVSSLVGSRAVQSDLHLSARKRRPSREQQVVAVVGGDHGLPDVPDSLPNSAPVEQPVPTFTASDTFTSSENEVSENRAPTSPLQEHSLVSEVGAVSSQDTVEYSSSIAFSSDAALGQDSSPENRAGIGDLQEAATLQRREPLPIQLQTTMRADSMPTSQRTDLPMVQKVPPGLASGDGEVITSTDALPRETPTDPLHDPELQGEVRKKKRTPLVRLARSVGHFALQLICCCVG